MLLLFQGTALHPADPKRMCGGSSSGCAAMVASGAVPFAIANDGGGSIRIPAALCGVTGLKPTLGRTYVSIWGVLERGGGFRGLDPEADILLSMYGSIWGLFGGFGV